MIGWIKSVLKAILPLGMYVSIMGSGVAALLGYPLLAIAVVTAITPLPNVWYQIHSFPLGKDVIDLLVMCCLIGLWTGSHIQQSAKNNVLLIMYILVMYMAVWNASLNYDLPMPVTPSNGVLVGWKNYVQMIIMYFIVYHAVGDEKRQQQLVYLMMIVLFLIVARDARNFTSGLSFSYESRAEGPFWQVGLGPNHYGAFIVHFGAVALALSFYVLQRHWRWLLLATSIIAVKPLFSTYSRGAWAAALAVLVLFGLLRKRSLLILVAAVIISWQTLLPEDVVDRISMTETTQGELESSAGDRVVLWDLAWGLFKDKPVFGNGLDAFELSGVGGRYTNVHNLYIETLAEIGIIGLLFLVTIMIKALRAGWALFRSGRNEFDIGLGLGFAGCVLAIMITNIFGDRWSYFSIGVNFWILWAIVERKLSTIQATPPVPEPAPEDSVLRR